MTMNFLGKKLTLSWKIPALIEKITIIILLIAGLSFNIPKVKDFIQCKIFDGASDSAMMIFFFSAICSAVVVLVFQLGEKHMKLIQSIEKSKFEIDSKLFFKGTLNIYNDVSTELEDMIKDGKKIEMDVLGFTLFSVKTKFSQWKENNALKNITINLYYLDPSYIRGNSEIDNSWEAMVNINVDGIKRFIDAEKVYLRKNKIKVNFYPYKHIPAVHGFRLVGSCLFVSFASWDNKILHDPTDQSTYIKIQNGDNTRYAGYLRLLFDNWAKKARP